MIDAEQIEKVINDALERDRTAIDKLFMLSVQANKALAEHESITVSAEGELSVLGLINGILAKDGKILVAYLDGNSLINYFKLENLSDYNNIKNSGVEQSG